MVPLVLVEIGGGSICVSACTLTELVDISSTLNDLLYEVKRYAAICMYTGGDPRIWKVVMLLAPDHFASIDPIPILVLSEGLNMNTIRPIIDIYRYRLGCTQLSVALFSTSAIEENVLQAYIPDGCSMVTKALQLHDCRTSVELIAQLRLIKQHARYILLSSDSVDARVECDERGVPSRVRYENR